MTGGSSGPPPAPAVHRLPDLLEACIHCGECLPACPTFLVSRREPHSPRGRIALLQALSRGEAEAGEVREPLETCLGCMACQTACPVGVNYEGILREGRKAVGAGAPPGPAAWREPGRRLAAQLLRTLAATPRWLRRLAAAHRVYRRSGLAPLLRRAGLDRRLLGPLAELEAALPEPVRFVQSPGPGCPPCPAAAARAPAEPGQTRSAVLFLGCVQEAFFGAANQAARALLAGVGLQLVEAHGQTCCGALHEHGGEHARARDLARQNIAALEEAGDAWIVSAAGGCGAFLTRYPELFLEELPWQERARAVAARVRDISQVLVERSPLDGGGSPPSRPRGGRPLRVTLQHSCHLRHVQGVADEPRRLLRSLPGVEYVELPSAESCCGSAGLYGLTRPDFSLRILDAKMEEIRRLQPDVVVTLNPGCELQMRLGLQRSRTTGVRVEALSVFLAERAGWLTPAGHPGRRSSPGGSGGSSGSPGGSAP